MFLPEFLGDFYALLVGEASANGFGTWSISFGLLLRDEWDGVQVLINADE